MAYSVIESQQFFSLFQGNTSAYGMTVVGDIVDGKAQSKSQLVHSELTMAVINKHLLGECSVGVAPLQNNNMVRWCAIDIDSYSGNLMDIVEAIEYHNIPILPCFSKSKKLHCYIFFSEDVPAEDAISLARNYATLFQCDPKVEIFPKQSKTSVNNKFYSWINLPYFEANEENHRKCVRADGTLLSLSEFVTRAQENRLSLVEHTQRLSELPFDGSPPCVRSGAILRNVPPGTRNNWLYNVACFLRMSDEDADIVTPLLELNASLKNPLDEREIQTTVAKVASRTYFYQCAGMVGCNKQICKGSEKGIGSNGSTKFNFGQLTKIMTDPIQWEWEINNQVLRFQDTTEIMNQHTFRRMCMERLNDVPFTVKEEKWTSILRRALENLEIKQVDVYGNFGAGSVFMTAIVDYFNQGRAQTPIESRVHDGLVYKDDANRCYKFSSSDILRFLSDSSGIRIRSEEVRIRLIEMGAEQVEGVIWKMPMDRIPEKKRSQVEVDYHDNDQVMREAEEHGF